MNTADLLRVKGPGVKKVQRAVHAHSAELVHLDVWTIKCQTGDAAAHIARPLQLSRDQVEQFDRSTTEASQKLSLAIWVTIAKSKRPAFLDTTLS